MSLQTGTTPALHPDTGLRSAAYRANRRIAALTRLAISGDHRFRVSGFNSRRVLCVVVNADGTTAVQHVSAVTR